jgi:hypothetical protein
MKKDGTGDEDPTQGPPNGHWTLSRPVGIQEAVLACQGTQWSGPGKVSTPKCGYVYATVDNGPGH